MKNSNFYAKVIFLVYLRQNFAGLRTNYYCPTGEFLFPNWKTCSLTRKILFPHGEIFAASPESFCRHVWEFLPPDLKKSFARPGSLCRHMTGSIRFGWVDIVRFLQIVNYKTLKSFFYCIEIRVQIQCTNIERIAISMFDLCIVKNIFLGFGVQ